MTSTTNFPQGPPEPYFDEDDMIDDYMDAEDDFGGPPPPPPSTAKASSNANHIEEKDNNDYFDDDDDDFYNSELWDEQMSKAMEQNERVDQNQLPQPDTPERANSSPAKEASASSTRNHEPEKAEENPSSQVRHGQNNTNTSVEEYLASRRQENNLYNFERYKRSTDWRAIKASSKVAPRETQRRQRLFASSIFSSVNSMTSTKTIAPEARFLRLLEVNGYGTANSKFTENVLQKASSNGTHNIFRSRPKDTNALTTIPMTLADGNRVYVRCTPPCQTSRQSNKKLPPLHNSKQKSCALGVSMRELFRRVDAMKRRKISMTRKRPLVESPKTTNDNVDDCDDMLWVDKHAPKSFPHLLSDERTNREVLRALRGWDPYVFGKAPPPRPLYQRQREEEQQELSNKNSGNYKKNDQKSDSSKDTGNISSDKRPEESARVILLSGPPGVGKTTLAHVVSRHAGYRPVEVNASDERSSGVLMDRIQRAMESTTIAFNPERSTKNTTNTDDYGKPNCLILDEIDGADARGSIQALVDIVKAEIPSKNSKNTAAPYLKRPIICICNHKYAPALRPLLPYASHFNVEPPTTTRLVARLKAILNEEKMPLLGGASLLHQLVASNGGDIRSSLFTLQFAAAEKDESKDISLALANALTGSGLKDNRADIASTISTVFRKQKAKDLQFSGTGNSRSKGKIGGTSVVMDAIDSLGDDSAAVNALFLNVPRVSYIDPAFDRCSAAHELLSFAADAHHQQSGYAVSVVTAGIHLLCRVEVKPNLTYTSRELSDMKYRKDTNMGLVRRFSEGLPTAARNLKCSALLAEEFIPLAMWVLSAGDGAASLSRAASSIEILTHAERAVAKNHVAALSALGLTYVIDNERQEQIKHSSFRSISNEMRMEPPIDRLVEYSSLNYHGQIRRKEIPSKMKELLAHEILLESFRNRDVSDSTGPNLVKEEISITEVKKAPPTVSAETTEVATNISSPAKVVTPRKIDEASPSTSLPSAKRVKATPSPTAGNFLGIAARKGKAAKSARRAAALGLTSASSSKQKLAHTGSGFLLSNVVRMKYVKGFTQAVRTPCRLNDLE